jgi:hypothetical protein
MSDFPALMGSGGRAGGQRLRGGEEVMPAAPTGFKRGGSMSNAIDLPPEWYLLEVARRALREAPPFVPGPDPVVEAMREAEALRNAGRLN